MLVPARPAAAAPRDRLPIDDFEEQIAAAITEHQVIVLVGETGSGKSTQLPQILYRSEWGGRGMIGITQPRKVAATSVARRVAAEMGSTLGDLVGYKIRHDNETGPTTRIKFMTTGILLREIQADMSLAGYSVIVVDEAHERSLESDFLLGLLKQITRRRADLRVIVTSATINPEEFSAFLGDAPILRVPGRLHPVSVTYASQPVGRQYVAAAVDTVRAIHSSGAPGHVLLFMPGYVDIRQTCQGLQHLGLRSLEVLPLYGSLRDHEQDRIFQPVVGRKVIVATNIAETSITVDGVRFVVDSGLVKRNSYDAVSHTSALRTEAHSKAGLNQRAGRAGRTAPGVCYRLFTEEDYNARIDFSVPDVLSSDLCSTVLQMKALGIRDIEAFDFLDSPGPDRLRAAYETLIRLGAIDREADTLTPIGEKMSRIPAHPRISRMVIAATQYRCVDEVTTIAAGMELGSVFITPDDYPELAEESHAAFRVPTSDFLSLLNAWQGYMAAGQSQRWCRERYLNSRTLAEMTNARQQILEVVGDAGFALDKVTAGGKTASEPEASLEERVARCLAAGLIDNLCELSNPYLHQYIRDGQSVAINPGSVLFKRVEPPMLIASRLTRRDSGKVTADACMAVHPLWLEDAAPQWFRCLRSEPHYDPVRDEVACQETVFFRNELIAPLTIRRRTVAGEKAVAVFAAALASGNVDMLAVTRNEAIRQEVAGLYRLARPSALGWLFDWLRGRRRPQLPRELTKADLVKFYLDRLAGITNKRGAQSLDLDLRDSDIEQMLEIDDYVGVRSQILVEHAKR